MLNREKITKKKVFSPLLPPPNITGRLHFGHFFDQFIINIYILFNKKKNNKTFITKYLDYGGISSEVLIKREYSIVNDESIGRFTKKNIDLILKDLNNSLIQYDSNSYLYTLDESYRGLVIQVFYKLFKDGYLKRFPYVVNYCNKCETVISDEEIVYIEKKQKMYFINYYTKSSDYITVATTRPETIFFDTFIVTNLKNDIKKVKIPITNKEIPVIYSPKNISDKGTNYLKVTPNIDKNDFYIYFSLYKTIPKEKELSYEEKEYLKDFFHHISPYISQIKDVISKVPCCYRCKENISNNIQKQWFLDSKKMIQKVNFDNINFSPENIKNEIQFFVENMSYWCISRQLKFGHVIPFFCDICNSFVENDFHCGKNIKTEVFDVWFVSSLAAIYHFKTTGMKNNFLTCGRDILFFWVIKMLIMNKYFYNDEMFEDIYLHGLIRDKNNEKLSKSKSNYISLEDLRNKYSNKGLSFFLLNSFKKNQDMSFNINDFDFLNFNIKIENAMILYEKLKTFPIKKMEIDDKIYDYFFIYTKQIYSTSQSI